MPPHVSGNVTLRRTVCHVKCCRVRLSVCASSRNDQIMATSTVVTPLSTPLSPTSLSPFPFCSLLLRSIFSFHHGHKSALPNYIYFLHHKRSSQTRWCHLCNSLDRDRASICIVPFPMRCACLVQQVRSKVRWLGSTHMNGVRWAKRVE